LFFSCSCDRTFYLSFRYTHTRRSTVARYTHNIANRLRWFPHSKKILLLFFIKLMTFAWYNIRKMKHFNVHSFISLRNLFQSMNQKMEVFWIFYKEILHWTLINSLEVLLEMQSVGICGSDVHYWVYVNFVILLNYILIIW
jgi:hypothetical protein